MSEAEAQKVIVGSIVVTAAVVGWTGIKSGGKAAPNLKTLTAMGVLAAALLLAASVVPSLAAGFAVLTAIAIAVSRTGK